MATCQIQQKCRNAWANDVGLSAILHRIFRIWSGLCELCQHGHLLQTE